MGLFLLHSDHLGLGSAHSGVRDVRVEASGDVEDVKERQISRIREQSAALEHQSGSAVEDPQPGDPRSVPMGLYRAPGDDFDGLQAGRIRVAERHGESFLDNA